MVALKLTKLIAITAALLTIYSSLANVVSLVDLVIVCAVATLILSSIKTSPQKIFVEKSPEQLSLGRMILLALLGWVGFKIGGELLKNN